MTRRKRSVSVWIILFLGFAASTTGQETRIRKADLPAAVQRTADEQSKGATVRGYERDKEGGQLEYEVEMTVSGHHRDVTIDPNGNLLEVEEQIPLNKLPPQVREGLQKKAGSGKITKVESIVKRGTLAAYEAHVLDGGKTSEVQVGPDGKALDHEE